MNAKFLININCDEFICTSDQLDGINAGLHNDVFLYGTACPSISFLGETNSDKVGVWRSEDAFPDSPAGIKIDIKGSP